MGFWIKIPYLGMIKNIFFCFFSNGIRKKHDIQNISQKKYKNATRYKK